MDIVLGQFRPPSTLKNGLPLDIDLTLARGPPILTKFVMVVPSPRVKSWFTSLNRSRPFFYTYFPVLLFLPPAKYLALWPVRVYLSRDVLLIIFPWVDSLKLLLGIASYPVFFILLYVIYNWFSFNIFLTSLTYFMLQFLCILPLVSRNSFRSL